MKYNGRMKIADCIIMYFHQKTFDQITEQIHICLDGLLVEAVHIHPLNMFRAQLRFFRRKDHLYVFNADEPRA